MYLYLQKYKDSSRFSIMPIEELLSITSFQVKVSIFTKTLKVLFGIHRTLAGSPSQPVYANLTCPKNTLLGFALNIWCASISWIYIYWSTHLLVTIIKVDTIDWWRIPVYATNSFKNFILQFNYTHQLIFQPTSCCMLYLVSWKEFSSSISSFSSSWPLSNMSKGL